MPTRTGPDAGAGHVRARGYVQARVNPLRNWSMTARVTCAREATSATGRG